MRNEHREPKERRERKLGQEWLGYGKVVRVRKDIRERLRAREDEEGEETRRAERGAERDELRVDERDPILVSTNMSVLAEQVRDVHLAVGVVPRLSDGYCGRQGEEREAKRAKAESQRCLARSRGGGGRDVRHSPLKTARTRMPGS